jgi:5-methylcytosine-specific restriction endonuclease McrA
MLIDPKLLDLNLNNGTPNCHQLRALGEPWPPISGWRKRILVREVSQEQIDVFLKCVGTKKERRQNVLPLIKALGIKTYVSDEMNKRKARKPRKERKPREREQDPRSDDFLWSFAWRSLRMKAFQRYGNKCQCCGASPATGAVLNVDHVKPRKTHPELALDLENLQILCHECNHGKANRTVDWRTPPL